MKLPVTLCLNILILMSFFGCQMNSPQKVISVSGELKKWHKVTLTIDGPQVSEFDEQNPFLDYRLETVFTNGSTSYRVPGYFASDGNAAETSATEGNKWRVNFCPDKEGTWEYRISFIKGKDIAIRSDLANATSLPLNGMTGSFKIGPTDKTGKDHRAKGRLRYVDKHYLQYAETGEYFLKGGADSPENFLGYVDFDGTYYGGKKHHARDGEAMNKGLHAYEPHVADWIEGDPLWQGSKGKGIIGALNYLASKGMNTVYFLTMNVMGDGDDVWPWTDRNERYRFDCSKLDQWEIVFEHMDKLGIMLHVVLQETENECLLDAGHTDVQRKLYYRELVARFSHHLAITWNMGEENGSTEWSPIGQTTNQKKQMLNYIKQIDPYKNFAVIHTHANNNVRKEMFEPLLGFKNLDGPSMQIGNIKDIHRETKYWRQRSADSLKPWVIFQDEIGPAHKGALPDENSPTHDTIRHYALWGNLMAGGAGSEWYFGYKYPNNDLNCEDWRSRDKLWDITRYALEFFRNHLPFHEMINMDLLANSAEVFCFAKPGEVYAVYLPAGMGKTKLNLTGIPGEFDVWWYNPVEGGDLIEAGKVNGNSRVDLKANPENPEQDWVIFLKKS